MQPQLLITVDTELSNFPGGQGLWGKIDGESWGLERMIDTFDSFNVKATFFLDVYGRSDLELKHQEAAAKLIATRGHDLQLHTHPAPAFDRARQQLRDYDFDEQCEIIRLGSNRIHEWSGVIPTLHRAGDWAADHISIRALRECGFHADFSASMWSSSCGYDKQLINGNGWARIDNLLCGVGTCYQDRLTGRLRRLDIGGVSFSEALDVLSRQVNPLFLTLHSFSFFKFNRARTDFRSFPGYAKQLGKFCKIAREQWGYRTMTALEAVSEIEAQPSIALTWTPLPTTGALSSAAGIVKSVRGRFATFAQ